MNQQSTGSIKSKVLHLDHAKSYSGEDDGYKYCITIMVSAEDSGGAWTYTHDTYEKKYVVPLHFHKEHDEIFSIIEGEMEWKIGDSSYVTIPGTTLWIPKRTSHGFKALTDCRLNMFYSPGGYEYVEEEKAIMTPEDMKNEIKKRAFLEKYDIFEL